MKIDREKIYQKFKGHCAYCGNSIAQKEMHVDHAIPKYRYSEIHQCLIVDGKKFTDYGLNDFENLYPACRACNLWKSTHTIEQFRHEISEQVNRLRKYSAQFRMAERYNLTAPTNNAVIFYFERLDTTTATTQEN